MTKTRLTSAFALTIFLAACGGGGSDSGGAPGGTTGSSSSSSSGSSSGSSSASSSSGGDAGPFVLAGRIQARPFSGSDGDTNDEFAHAQVNNRAAEAQPLAVPALLGGFVASSATGASTGRFRDQADPDDWFAISAQAGTQVLLQIHRHQKLLPLQNDLDLFLYRQEAPAEPIASSTDIDEFESLTVPHSGDFLLRVNAARGYSQYTLRLDRQGLSHSHSSPSVANPMVAGELLVQRGGDTPQGWQRETLSAEILDEALAVAGALHTGLSGTILQRLQLLYARKSLLAQSDTLRVEPNFLYHRSATPNDPLYLRQWHYRSIELPAAWSLSESNSDIVIAVLDTGIFSAHPDLADKIREGYDLISDPQRARDGDGPDPDPEDPGDLAQNPASSWHGTHVAGTAAADTDNAEGVSGSGWNTSIMPLRVLGVGGGTSYDAAQAVLYAAGLANGSGALPTRSADIINMSFGGSGYSQILQDAIDAARSVGLIAVAAAGNDGTEAPSYPAALRGVLAVSATDATDELAYYSNFGDWVDIAAPGGDLRINAEDGILSTYVDEAVTNTASYRHLQGTSMAAPHVAGALALMKSLNPALAPDDVDALLAEGRLTRDIGETGRDIQFGHGLIDAESAALSANQPPEQRVHAEPGHLDFAGSYRRLTVEISDTSGGDNAIVDTPSADQPWIVQVTPDNVDAQGFGQYSVWVDRSALPHGKHTGAVVFPLGESRQFSLPVGLEHVAAAADSVSAGRQYLQLYRADESGTFSLLEQVPLEGDTGAYPFRFTEVPAGQYRLISGSDHNGNGILCEAGESCGYYPDAETTISLREDRSDLNFFSDYLNPAAEPQTIAR
ncbi:S8 family peptidase [Microbulbifer elongatus]|uniref:S8 family peptidase n=1 Tax=Microbulbifer elongatus TaxID=86173 RepID=A0ABT1P4D9_9GAMM|nr:S8 family peptidase [Microbulbifer elongatus]MCQ3830976.1 S8 family peptidase [Microbulbifer elongatus]